MMNAVERAPLTLDGNDTVSRGHVPGEGAMWFFVLGDLLIFGVYFVFYLYYRGQNQELFLQSQQHLNQGLGVVNTVILLTSSLFVALATLAAREQRKSRAINQMAIAIGLGAIFPLFKMMEWIPKLLAGMTLGENLFFTFYYLMTGMHLCHVLLGLVILGFVMRDLRNTDTPNVEFVETGAIYWHMVDLLWIILFALFYVMR